MKILKTATMVVALGLACVGHAQAQNNVNANLTANPTNNSTSGSTAANEGVNNTNNFNSTTPTDTTEHVKYSGVTGSNTGVGLGSFSSSFSSDYCGGTAQVGISVPYVTAAGGKPVLGEPGVPCVDIRAGVHTMEFSVSFGTAAAKNFDLAAAYDKLAASTVFTDVKSVTATASRISPEEAAEYRKTAANLRAAGMVYSEQSVKLATAATNMLCNVSDDVRQAYRDAGILCPKTKQEKADEAKAQQQATQQQAVANNQPTDPFVRQRMGLQPLQ
jgi:hypothetical protein